MEYILSGDPQAVKNVLQENRLRVNRGLINFNPLQPDAEKDAKIADLTACNETLNEHMTVLENERTRLFKEIEEKDAIIAELQSQLATPTDPMVNDDKSAEVSDSKEPPIVEDAKEPVGDADTTAVSETSDEKAPKTKRSKKSE